MVINICLIFEPWRIHMCAVTYSHMCHDSYICASDALLCVVPWRSTEPMARKASTYKSTNSRQVLQCVAVCCSVLQRVAVRCSVLHCVAVCFTKYLRWSKSQDSRQVLQCVELCCIVLHCVAVCCNALQCVAACCSVLQCVALSICAYVFRLSSGVVMCYSVMQCVVVCCSVL